MDKAEFYLVGVGGVGDWGLGQFTAFRLNTNVVHYDIRFVRGNYRSICCILINKPVEVGYRFVFI